MTSLEKIWFITGAASGLGFALVERLLRRGDIVVATARNIDSLSSLRKIYEGFLFVENLDVTDEQEVARVMRKSIDRLGRVDVVVNNAGYGTLLPFEQTTNSSFRAEIETNFFGTINVIREALPSMRKERSGLIINVSSSAARVGAPGMAAYCAAKAAVSVFTESLAKEVKPFGVTVVAVEPGSIRTNWTRQAISAQQSLIGEYEETVGALLAYAQKYAGSEPGDPQKYAAIIAGLVHHSDLPTHLLLGPAAVQMVENDEENRRKDAAKWAKISSSTDFES